jgi:WD40 repeat protein
MNTMKRRTRWLTPLLLLLFMAPAMLCFGDEPMLVIDPQGHSAMIRKVMLTPDGATLISVSDDKTIRLWDVKTGDLMKTIRGQIGAGNEGELFAGALSPDGKTLAAGGFGIPGGDKPIHLYNIETGEQIGLLKGHFNVINALAFSPDGRRLASGSGDHTVRIWDVTGRKELAKLEGHGDAVYGVAFSPDGSKLVSASYDGTLRLWHIGNLDKVTWKEMKRHTDKVNGVAFAPNGRYIVSGGYDNRILLWDGNGNFLKEIGTHDVGTISFSSDSRKIVVAGESQDPAAIYAIPSGEKVSTFTKHTNTVLASAFYGNDLVATAGGDDKDIYLWDASSGTVKTHIIDKGRSTWAVAFGEGLNVAFGNSSSYIDDSNRGPLEKSFDFSAISLKPQLSDTVDFQRVRLQYQGRSFEKKGLYELNIVGGGSIHNDFGYDGQVRCYSFTPDGNVVVGSSFSLKLYRSDGAFIRNFIGQTGELWAVSVDRSGRILASASGDQTIRLWSIQSGKLLATLFVTRDNEWICWTPQGYYAASAGGEKYIGWQINRGLENAAEYYPAYVFRKQFHNEELVKRTIEWASFEKALAEYNSKPGIKVEATKINEVLPPEVSWLSPDNSYTKTKNGTIPVKAKIKSSEKITAIKIQVNGRTVATTSEIRITDGVGRFDKIVECQVPLNPKQNDITIYAENSSAFATSKVRTVFFESTDWMKPNLYMVAIGISEYVQKNQNLNYAADDARSISQIFSGQQGKLFKNVSIKSLYNNNAKRDDIIKALQWLADSATQKDVAILFVAAHGYNERGRYYILPHDGHPDNLMSDGVGQPLIGSTLGNLPARVLLLVDTCHAGQLGQDFVSRGQNKNDITEMLRELSSPEYGMVIMAASTAAEESQERPAWGHGAFTKALIEGLQDGKADQNGDGVIHLNELDAYISERVKNLTGGKQHSNTQKPSTISRFPLFEY